MYINTPVPSMCVYDGGVKESLCYRAGKLWINVLPDWCSNTHSLTLKKDTQPLCNPVSYSSSSGLLFSGISTLWKHSLCLYAAFKHCISMICHSASHSNIAVPSELKEAGQDKRTSNVHRALQRFLSRRNITRRESVVYSNQVWPHRRQCDNCCWKLWKFAKFQWQIKIIIICVTGTWKCTFHSNPSIKSWERITMQCAS